MTQVNEAYKQDVREIIHEQVLKLASRMFRGDWPEGRNNEEIPVDNKGAGTWTLGYTRNQGFMQASVFVKPLEARITLIEANPQKVHHSEDKVMVYYEPEPGAGEYRVGQVRRHWKGDQSTLELVWFPV